MVQARFTHRQPVQKPYDEHAWGPIVQVYLDLAHAHTERRQNEHTKEEKDMQGC